MSPAADPGARRVAVLLSSLDVESGRNLLREFPASDRRKVLVEVARLEVDPPSRAEIEATLQEFQSMREPSSGLARALVDVEGDPDERRLLLERIEAAIRSVPFGFLAKAGAARMAEALKDEHPQTLALVAACLPAGASAQMLDRLPLRTQTDVVRRLATLDAMPPETVARIEKALESRFAGRREKEAAGGFQSAASVLSRALPETSRRVLAALDENDPDLAARLRDELLSFDDLGGITDQGLARLAAGVEMKTLAAALKSSAPDFSSRLFRVLPPAEAALLGSTIDAMGPATLDDITEARREICQVARILESRGELVRPLRRE